jgi:Acyl-CoA dehydrogenase, N-terminal domain
MNNITSAQPAGFATCGLYTLSHNYEKPLHGIFVSNMHVLGATSPLLSTIICRASKAWRSTGFCGPTSFAYPCNALRKWFSTPSESHRTFGLSPEQLEMKQTVDVFARERLMPHGARWDTESFFPVDTMREAAHLGFAGKAALLSCLQIYYLDRSLSILFAMLYEQPSVAPQACMLERRWGAAACQGPMQQ